MPPDDRESFVPAPPSGLPVDYQNPYAPQSGSAPHPFFEDLNAATPRAYFVPILIAINIAVFVAMGLSGVGWIVPNPERTIAWGVDFWPLTTSGEWWRLLTSAFIHFGVFHIGFNMWALYAVGMFTERLFGNLAFLLIYLFTAVLSGITSIWFEHQAVAAGASGAIFAIYGALLAYLLVQRSTFPTGAVKHLLRNTLGFIAINIGLGFYIKGISNGAHLGGLATGIILGAVFARPLDPARRKRQAIPKLLAGVALATAMIVVGLAYIPRESPGMAGDVRFTIALDLLAPRQRQAEAKVNALVSTRAMGKINDADFAHQLEIDVIPTWSDIYNRLNAIPITPGSTNGAKFQSAINFARVTRDLFTTQAALMRHPDKELINTYERLAAERHKIIQERRQDHADQNDGE